MAVIIEQITDELDYMALADVWRRSVKATHHFLSEADFGFYSRRIVSDYMPHVELYAIRNMHGHPIAFVGLSDDNIEMLFVHPDEMGKGYGTSLLDFAVEEKGIGKVDVNEQNLRALNFYRKHGFTVMARDATDSEGKTYPVLHMAISR